MLHEYTDEQSALALPADQADHTADPAGPAGPGAVTFLDPDLAELIEVSIQDASQLEEPAERAAEEKEVLRLINSLEQKEAIIRQNYGWLSVIAGQYPDEAAGITPFLERMSPETMVSETTVAQPLTSSEIVYRL